MSVRVTCPASDALPFDDFHARRALLGGTLARAWISFVVAGTRYAISISHGGSRANPVTFEAALAGASHAYATLSSGARTGVEVATAIAAAATGLGLSPVRVDDEVTIAGATGLLVGGAMSTGHNLTRGLWGMQRFDWGDPGLMLDGAMGGTGSVHIGSPGTGRIHGLYVRAAGGVDMRVALCRGPAYSTNPGVMDVLAQGVISAVTGNALRALVFADPIAVDDEDDLWVVFRATNSGTLVYRPHGDTPEGNGDIVVGQRLVWDTDVSNPATALGATYTPNVANTFAIYMFVGAIFELAPYAGDGSIATIVGPHQPANDGTPSVALPAITVDEIISVLFPMPAWTSTELVAAEVDVAAWNAADDVSITPYDWNDTALPTASTNPRLAASQRMQTSGTGWQRRVLTTPVDVGTDALGASAVVAITLSIGLIAGGQANALAIRFDDENPGGTRTWPTAWVDNGREWSDLLTDQSVASEIREYVTLGTAEDSDMLAAAPASAQPTPYDPSAFDVRPRNLPRVRIELARAGLDTEEIAEASGVRQNTAARRHRRVA